MFGRALPHHGEQLQVSFPDEHVFMITFNRPEALNAMTPQMESDIKTLLDWFDSEAVLWQVTYARQPQGYYLKPPRLYQGCYCDGSRPRILCRSRS